MQTTYTKNGRAAINHTAQVYGQNKTENPLFSRYFKFLCGVLGLNIAGTGGEHIMMAVQNPCSSALTPQICPALQSHDLTPDYGTVCSLPFPFGSLQLWRTLDRVQWQS